MDGGLAQDAFTDMTGAIGETIDITKCLDYDDNASDDDDDDDENDEEDEDEDDEHDEDDDEDDDDDYPDQQDNEFDNNGHIQYLSDLWKYMVSSYNMHQSLLNASFNPNEDEDDSNDEDQTLPNGLVPNHAYSLYQVVEVKFGKGDRVRLIKLRNPHGTKKSWKGAYSIDNKRWKNLSPALKKKYDLSLSPNGEFYMTFEDFVDNFEEVNILHINLNAFLTINPGANAVPQLNTKWRCVQLYEEWKSGINAGLDDRDYWQNCQFLIEINALHNNLTSIIVGLMQPYSAQLRYENKGEMAYAEIGFDIYTVVCNPNKIRDNRVNRQRFNQNDLELVDSNGEHSHMREVTKKCFLKSGFYVIIPSTDYHKSIQYLLRLFYDTNSVNSIEKLTN